MELREPPSRPDPAGGRRLLVGLVVAQLVLTAGVAVVFLARGASRQADPSADRLRSVASKLLSAGALDEAAEAYRRVLEAAGVDDEVKGRIAFTVGSRFMERGAYERALRWLYEAEILGVGDLHSDLSRRVVTCLERLGQVGAANAALASRTRLGEPASSDDQDPVVAQLGDRVIRRSELDQAVAALPVAARGQLRDPAARHEFLRRYAADDVLWRKAQKLGYASDPEVRNMLSFSLRRLVVAEYLEREVMGAITVEDLDLRSFFEANLGDYRAEGEVAPGLEAIRPLVERDYRLEKFKTAVQALIDGELGAAGVDLFPERWRVGER